MSSPHESVDEPPPAALPPKRLFRDPTGPIGGVASGFAGYFNIDPVIARLLWVVALLSGIGLPAYVLCWVIIPKARSWPPPGYAGQSAASASNDASWISGLIIVALAAMIGTGLDGVGDYLLPAALVGFGVYLLNQRGAAAPDADTAAAGVDEDPFGPDSEHDAAGAPGTPEATGLVTPTVLGVLAIGAGSLVALRAAGIIADVPLGLAAAAGLVIVGGGLIASLWFGRARGLIPLGAGLGVVMLAASAGDELSRGTTALAERGASTSGVGDQHYRVTSFDELQGHYELGVGKLTLDLSQLDFTGKDRDVSVDVGMGEAIIIVPEATAVDVRGEVGVGEAEALGRKNGGLHSSIESEDSAGGAGKLSIDFDVGIGKGVVRRAH